MLGLLGLGTVGTSVVRLIRDLAPEISLKLGEQVLVKKALIRDPMKSRDPVTNGVGLVLEAGEILNDPEIEIVVEVMGGIRPALDYILEALRRRKPVVTANKEVMANYGREVFAASDESATDIYFEASVAGGIPIIRPLKYCLAANQIEYLIGIINGTSNYILSKMTSERVSMDEALAEAMAKGFAEADPSLDLSGHDAASKLAILASIAFGSRVKPDQIPTQGIEGVTSHDIDHAEELGFSIKPLAVAKRTTSGLSVRVGPSLIPLGHPLAAVNDANNAIFIRGSAAGNLMFYGQGAGGMPTASAVVADVIEAARNLRRHSRSISCTCFHQERTCEPSTITGVYYVRVNVRDHAGALAEVAGVLARHGVGVVTALQRRYAQHVAEAVVVTTDVPYGYIKVALDELTSTGVVTSDYCVMYVEGIEEADALRSGGIAREYSGAKIRGNIGR